jgi:hypothetical protein
MLERVFGFGRRGGSNKNLLAMSESINDAGFGGVVGRHLHFHPVPNRKANEPPLAHLPGNVRENKMVIRERDAKHRTREHRHDGAFQFDRFFRIPHVDFGNAANKRAPRSFRATAAHQFRDLPALACKRALPAVRTRTFFAWTRLVNS